MTHDQREIRRKKRVLEYAERIGNINKACRYFGVSRSSFYEWRGRYRSAAMGRRVGRTRRDGLEEESHHRRRATTRRTPPSTVGHASRLRTDSRIGPRDRGRMIESQNEGKNGHHDTVSG